MHADLQVLEERLGYTFADRDLLIRALTHKSLSFEKKPGDDEAFIDNEQLEFLGDSVLGLVVTDMAFAAFPDKQEGELAKLRAAIVNAQALADVARSLGLGALVRLGKGEEQSGGRDKASILAELSFHGAVYSSDVISFSGTETESNELDGDHYRKLDTPAADVADLLQKHSSGSIPFVDFGGKFVLSGATYDPGVLQGKTALEISKALLDPSTKIAKGVIGSANVLTAAICAATDGKPAKVCAAAPIADLSRQLAAGIAKAPRVSERGARRRPTVDAGHERHVSLGLRRCLGCGEGHGDEWNEHGGTGHSSLPRVRRGMRILRLSAFC